MIRIREATGFDVPWLLEQLREFADFYGTKRSLFPSDDAVAHALITHLITQGKFFLAVDHASDKCVGFIAGLLGPSAYNPEITQLTELFWWVAPSRRGSSAGARLLNRFEEYGREVGADWLVMTLEAKSPVDPASLERRGFRLHERSYLMEVA